jgi:hypothetical protein
MNMLLRYDTPQCLISYYEMFCFANVPIHQDFNAMNYAVIQITFVNSSRNGVPTRSAIVLCVLRVRAFYTTSLRLKVR